VHFKSSSVCLLQPYWTDRKQETGVTRTRLCRERGRRVAPRSRSDGVVGLYLNLVLGPGIQALHRGLTGPPRSLHVLGPVLPLAVRPPQSQPVPHGLRAAVVLGLWKRLQGDHREDEGDVVLSCWPDVTH